MTSDLNSGVNVRRARRGMIQRLPPGPVLHIVLVSPEGRTTLVHQRSIGLYSRSQAGELGNEKPPVSYTFASLRPQRRFALLHLLQPLSVPFVQACVLAGRFVGFAVDED